MAREGRDKEGRNSRKGGGNQRDAGNKDSASSPPHVGEHENPHRSTDKDSSEDAGHTPATQPHWADRWIAILTGIILVTYIFGDYFSCRQLGITQRSVEIATEEMHRAHRPWVFVPNDGITTTQPLTFDARQIRASSSVLYVFRNTGNSPAINTMTEGYVIVDNERALLQKIQEKGPCDRKLIEMVTQVVGFFVAPGDSVRQKKAGEVHTLSAFPHDGPVGAVLQLCVGYRDEFNQPHGTGVSWNYITDAGIDSFEPVGAVPGRWEYYGVGTQVY
jgi:hypothetical protein